jgi:hypothetical protein
MVVEIWLEVKKYGWRDATKILMHRQNMRSLRPGSICCGSDLAWYDGKQEK